MKNLCVMAALTLGVLLLLPPAFAVVTITLVDYFTHAQVMYIADLDLLQTGSAPLLFQLTVHSDNPINDPRLHVQLFTSSSGTNPLAAGSLQLTSRYQTAPNTWVVTNQAMSRGEGSWESGENLSESYRNRVLATGMVPIDTYRFHFFISDGANGPELPNPYDHYFTVRGMGFVTLRFPDHDPTGASPLLSDLPFFTWQSSQDSFRIEIAHIPSGESPEGALQTRLNCREVVFGRSSYVYPSSGVLPLLPGQYCAWRIIAFVRTSHGVVEIPSEVRVFRIAPVITPEGRQLMVALQLLLTSGQGQQFLQLLQNGQLTGTLYINGVAVPAERLLAMVGDIAAGRVQILSMRIE